jgi:hypothetical protein
MPQVLQEDTGIPTLLQTLQGKEMMGKTVCCQCGHIDTKAIKKNPGGCLEPEDNKCVSCKFRMVTVLERFVDDRTTKPIPENDPFIGNGPQEE